MAAAWRCGSRFFSRSSTWRSTAIERSSVPLPTDQRFRLREHISRRPLSRRRRPVDTDSGPPAATRVDLSVFVVSWRGQHDRAVVIANAIRHDGGDVRIISSDPDLRRLLDADCPVVRRPNHLFWADKFTACLERCDTNAMLLIQADSYCDDWPDLVRRCRRVLTAVHQSAVWAPYIDGTPYGSDVATFGRVTGDGAWAAAQTDGIVLGLARPVLDRLRQARLDGNLYGWGIDQVAVAAVYADGRMAAIDLSRRVVHPPARGYPTEVAHSQWQTFLLQFSAAEQEWHDALWLFLMAGVAVKARATGAGIFVGGRLVAADGPESASELEARLAAARAALEERCAVRLIAARTAADAADLVP